MFQVFASKMFEQRVLTAYREKLILEKQKHLLEEERENEKRKKQLLEQKMKSKKEKLLKLKSEKNKAKEDRERKLKEQEREQEAKRQEELRKQEEKRKEKQKKKEEELLKKQVEENKLKEKTEAQKKKDKKIEEAKQKQVQANREIELKKQQQRLERNKKEKERNNPHARPNNKSGLHVLPDVQHLNNQNNSTSTAAGATSPSPPPQQSFSPPLGPIPTSPSIQLPNVTAMTNNNNFDNGNGTVQQQHAAQHVKIPLQDQPSFNYTNINQPATATTSPPIFNQPPHTSPSLNQVSSPSSNNQQSLHTPASTVTKITSNLSPRSPNFIPLSQRSPGRSSFIPNNIGVHPNNAGSNFVNGVQLPTSPQSPTSTSPITPILKHDQFNPSMLIPQSHQQQQPPYFHQPTDLNHLPQHQIGGGLPQNLSMLPIGFNYQNLGDGNNHINSSPSPTSTPTAMSNLFQTPLFSNSSIFDNQAASTFQAFNQLSLDPNDDINSLLDNLIPPPPPSSTSSNVGQLGSSSLVSGDDDYDVDFYSKTINNIAHLNPLPVSTTSTLNSLSSFYDPNIDVIIRSGFDQQINNNNNTGFPNHFQPNQQPSSTTSPKYLSNYYFGNDNTNNPLSPPPFENTTSTSFNNQFYHQNNNLLPLPSQIVNNQQQNQNTKSFNQTVQPSHGMNYGLQPPSSQHNNHHQNNNYLFS
eukprot:gene10313-12655_t